MMAGMRTSIVALMCVSSALGWGGLFNRFSPEMLSNLGYGGHGSSFRVQPFLQSGGGGVESVQEVQESEDEGPCYGRRCTANEHCCPAQVCMVDVHGMGICVFPYGLGQGELCRRHTDCDTGLICADTADTKTCQPPYTAPKQYSEECTMSSECDIHKGLCCQFQRRHRQVARKVCSYFKDPLVCIGPVASDQVKVLDMERTAGEKRITGKSASGLAAAFNHLRR